MSDLSAAGNGWSELRHYTPARVALGRIGSSLSTAEVLSFSMAHARTRDAVHIPLDTDNLASALGVAGFPTMQLQSEVANRAEYLKRPDLGRRLHPESQRLLQAMAPAPTNALTIVVADGLSSLACTRHALPMLLALRSRLVDWSVDVVMLATQARVAIADPIGELRASEATIILLGERPGLSSPDSLGAYLTYRPRSGRTDAERNCVSNIRPEGLSYAEASFRLNYLLQQCRLARKSGVSIKDGSDWENESEALLEQS